MSDRPPELRRDGTWVGASVRRREDPRLLTGQGRFVDDIHLSGMLHAQFVRSSIAMGRVVRVDLDRVREVPGVIAAFSADDLDLLDITPVIDRSPEEFALVSMPVLARHTVRFVGEPLAVVIATDPYAVEDGVEAARVDYESLPAVTSAQSGMAAGATQLHDEAPGNILTDVSLFASDDIDEVIATAPCVVDVGLTSSRQNALPMETRGAIAEWDERESQLVLHTSTQIPHLVRSSTAACLQLDERAVRVIVPDMGGGFGLKCVVGREEIAVAAAARRLGRPVKWIEDRRDALTASFLAREQEYRARAAFALDGEFLGLDVDVICDMGAYGCYPFTAAIEPLMASGEMPGVYKLKSYRVRGRSVATNKAPTAPYRGVSRPQYVMLIERLMERAARQLSLDPLDVRRRNLIDTFPYTSINNITYDAGSYRESLDLCEQILRDEGWFDRREQARAEGRYVGIGFACYNERTGYGSAAFAGRRMKVVPGFDLSEIRMDLTGAVTVTSGTMSHGQSHETTMAQIVADALQVDISKVKLHQGDTDRITYGFGTFASRSAVIGGSAVKLAAGLLAERLITIAAHLMETPLENLELDNGSVRRRDSGERITYKQLAEVAYMQAHRLPKNAPPGLQAQASFDAENDGTFSNATQGAVVELDAETGKVRILRYVCVEDCGIALNPQVVDGQVRGGIAQGIAGALFESVSYEDNGEPIGTSFLDYKVPTAVEMPDVSLAHLETPSTSNETGAKGVGEGGTIGAPATVLNAINDALQPVGVELNHTPVSPAVVHASLHGEDLRDAGKVQATTTTAREQG